MSPIETLKLLQPQIDLARLLRNTRDLWQTELGQTFTNYHASACLAEKLLRETGCERVERIAFPADGKTVYLDRTMPLGWQATQGKLEITRAAVNFADPIIADFERHPFHLVKGSVSTPPEGVETKLISEEDLVAGADARGAIVLLNPENSPMGIKFREVCDAGALGFVTDQIKYVRHATPEAIQWINAGTEGPSWHTRADGRSFIGFVVSPMIGDQLRVALRAGEVMVRAFSDGERSEDTIDVVTGVLPGEDAREVWLLAHLYEPLANDNSSGVACALEIMRTLQTAVADGLLPRPRFTLRVVFGMENYGFAAYAEKRGGWLGDEVLCAMNVDALPIVDSSRGLNVIFSQSCVPSSADYALEELTRKPFLRLPPTVSRLMEGTYGDDLLLGDSTTGLPSLWVNQTVQNYGAHSGRLWHNSEQTMDRIVPELFRNVTALLAAWTASTLAADDFPERIRRAVRVACERLEEEKERILALPQEMEIKGREQSSADWLDRRLEIESDRLRDFVRFGAESDVVKKAVEELAARCRELKNGIAKTAEPPAFQDKLWNLAESLVVCRVTRGMPHDMAAVPREKRNPLGYDGPTAIVLAQADGRRTVAELLLYAQWEEHRFYSPKEVRKCLSQLQYLAQYNYIALSASRAVTRDVLVQALRSTGIREGDLLVVHSSLSALGVVEGGAETIIDALLEVLGATGTLLMPTFVRSYLCFERGPARSRRLVPFHEDAPIWTGAIPDSFRKRPGVIRSAHVSHSVAGIGPLAEKCLSGQGATDAPAGPTSPWARLPELDGKIVFLGAPLSTCTFLHYLEDVAGVDYLGTAVCVIADEAKGRRLVTVPRHFPGGRDFYNSDAGAPENSKIFRRLDADGLKIERKAVGFSEVKVIEAKPLYQLGLKALQEDPRILL